MLTAEREKEIRQWLLSDELRELRIHEYVEELLAEMDRLRNFNLRLLMDFSGQQ